MTFLLIFTGLITVMQQVIAEFVVVFIVSAVLYAGLVFWAYRKFRRVKTWQP